MQKRNKLFLNLALTVLLSSFLHANQTFNSSPVASVTAVAGETITFTVPCTITGGFTINGDNVTVITNGNLIIGGAFTANNRSNINVTVSQGSLLQCNGPVTLVGTSTGTIAITGAGTGFSRMETNSTTYMKNVTVSNAGTALQSITTVGNVVTLEKVYLSASNYAANTLDCQFKARFCRFGSSGAGALNYTTRFLFNSTTIPAPIAEFCRFDRNAGTYHAYLTAPAGYTGGTADFEGSFLSSININPNITVDATPGSTSGDPLGTTAAAALQFTGGATIGFDKILPPNTALTIIAGGLTLPAGRTFRLGYDEYNAAYVGSSSLFVNNNENITVAAGGTIISNPSGTNNLISRAQGGNWGSLILQPGAHPGLNLNKTTIEYATTGITDQAGSSLSGITFQNFQSSATTALGITAAGGSYSGNTFTNIQCDGINTGVSCTIAGNAFSSTVWYPIRVTGGSPLINGANSISYSQTGITITGGTPTVQNNTLTGDGDATATAFAISGGSPVLIQGNTCTGYGSSYALNVSGTGTLPAGVFINNNFNSANPQVTNSNAGSIVYVQNNWWNTNPPSITNFSGTGAIQYEPWLSSSGGPAAPILVPATVAGVIYPVNGSNLQIKPLNVSFNVSDIGYHNGPVLQARAFIYDQTAGGLLIETVNSANIIAPTSLVTMPLTPGLYTFGHTYTWTAQAQNTTNLGWGTLNVPFVFTIDSPQVTLTLAADRTAASAGDTVRYRITYANNWTNAVANTNITSILPDDVYFNGNIDLNSLAASMGTVTVNAYTNVTGVGLPAGQVVYVAPVGARSITNATAGWLAAGTNTQIKRIDVQVQALNPAQTGTIDYYTIVK